MGTGFGAKRLTPKMSVVSRIRSTCAAMASAERYPPATKGNPPARATASVSAAVVVPPAMGAAMIGSSVFSKAIVTVFSHPHDCGMAACPLPFLHPARLGRRGVRARVPARLLGCWLLRDAAARASARFRGRGILVAPRETNVPLLRHQLFACAEP